jgi:hypothetical protein
LPENREQSMAFMKLVQRSTPELLQTRQVKFGLAVCPMREVHAKCVKIPRKNPNCARVSRVFPRKIVMASAVLNIRLKRVDSAGEVIRVR